MGNSKSNYSVKEKLKIKKPSLYKVILLNDDRTTMDFVVQILQDIFSKPNNEAVKIMLKVHNEGQAICGVFSKEIAETKCEAVQVLSKANGFPLKCVMEKE